MSQHQVSRLVEDPPEAKPCGMCVFHIAGGVLVAVIGGILIMTGAMAGPGVAVLTIGILYAVVAWVISMMPTKPVSEDAIP